MINSAVLLFFTMIVFPSSALLVSFVIFCVRSIVKKRRRRKCSKVFNFLALLEDEAELDKNCSYCKERVLESLAGLAKVFYGLAKEEKALRSAGADEADERVQKKRKLSASVKKRFKRSVKLARQFGFPLSREMSDYEDPTPYFIS